LNIKTVPEVIILMSDVQFDSDQLSPASLPLSAPEQGNTFPSSKADKLPAQVLARELIETCCGTHSLGLVYWFLRKAGMADMDARAHFELYLSGKLSEKLLELAARAAST
jgi:hypothetical protein